MMIATLMGTLVAGGIAFAVFLSFARKGEFDDCEEIKYQMLREKDEQ